MERHSLIDGLCVFVLFWAPIEKVRAYAGHPATGCVSRPGNSIKWQLPSGPDNYLLFVARNYHARAIRIAIIRQILFTSPGESGLFSVNCAYLII